MIKSSVRLSSKFFRIIFFLLFFQPIAFGKAPSVSAQSDSDLEVSMAIGFDDHCKFGYWLPIHVQFNTQSTYFTGHLSIAYSQSEYLLPISLTPNTEKSISTQIFTNLRDVNQTVTLRLLPDQENAPPIFIETKNLTCVSNRIVGVMTNTPSAFTILNALPPVDSTDVVLLTYKNLPENVLGLQTLDAIFISNTDTSKLNFEQYEAIKLWVIQGGHLIFGGGTDWGTTLFGFDELLPLIVAGSPTVNINTGFSNFGGPISLSDAILLEGTPRPNSRILLQEESYPLVFQSPLGAGTVSLLTFDPNIPAFRQSDNALLFYDYLLNSTLGSYDFTTVKDWNSAIDAVYLFQNQGLPSTWSVLIILILYVLLIGPVNFYSLKKMGKPEWLWYTTPIMVILLTVALVGIGWNFRGTKLQVNQLAIVHQWAGSDRAYASGMVGIFSPRRDSFQVQIEAGYAPYPFAPHNYFNTPNNEWDFKQSGTFEAATLINASETMPLGILGQAQPLSIESDLTLILESSTAILSGEIRNNSGIGLENVVLFFPGGFELVGDLPANETLRIYLPMGLLSQKSSNSSSVIYSGVYNPSTYYGSIIAGQIAPSTMAANNKIQQQLNLMEAILGNYTVPPVGFLLVGWNDTKALYNITISDEAFDSNHLTAYMISLPIGTVSSMGQMILPPALFNWFITENSSSKFSNPYEMRFGYQDQVEVYYKLTQPVSYLKLVELIIHLEGQDSRPDFPLDVYLWNYQQAHWDKFNVRNWGDILISNPDEYLDTNLGEVRIKLAENGTGGGEANVTRADVSLVVEP